MGHGQGCKAGEAVFPISRLGTYSWVFCVRLEVVMLQNDSPKPHVCNCAKPNVVMLQNDDARNRAAAPKENVAGLEMGATVSFALQF